MLYFLICAVLVTLVMMNLLIAIIGDTFNSVMENIERSGNYQLCKIIFELETIMIRFRNHYEEPKHIILAEYVEADIKKDTTADTTKRLED